jgi:hypothetical protein
MIDEVDIHFIHVRSRLPNPLPIITKPLSTEPDS